MDNINGLRSGRLLVLRTYKNHKSDDRGECELVSLGDIGRGNAWNIRKCCS